MYVYTYMYVYVYIDIDIDINIYIYVHQCKYTDTFIETYIGGDRIGDHILCTYVHACTHMYMYMYIDS